MNPSASNGSPLVEEPAPAPSRRCWRCLQTFACEEADVHAGPAQWWLCDPCHDSLIGDTNK